MSIFKINDVNIYYEVSGNLNSKTAIAFALWSQLLKYNKVGIISVFNFLIPVFGTILSSIILKENIFDIKILVALLLVCTGIYLVYKRKDN